MSVKSTQPKENAPSVGVGSGRALIARYLLALVAAAGLLASACGSNSESADANSAAPTTTTTEVTTPEPTAVPVEVSTPEPTATPTSEDDPEVVAEAEPAATDDMAPPANDEVANAVEIDLDALPFRQSLDVTGATVDDDDEQIGCPAPALDTSVWYSITPTEDMTLRVGAEGSDFPAGISVAQGSPGSLELIECRPFAFFVPVESGQTYYFQAFDGDDPTSQGGTLEFVLEQVELTSTEGLEPLGQEYVQTVASNVEFDAGGLLFAVVDPSGDVVAGSNGSDARGEAPTADATFRVGSITKVFTSVATLTLVDDGLVDLDASAADYVTRVPLPADVTVRNLLQHSSGIDSYTDNPAFFDTTFADLSRVWTPEDAFEWVADEPQLFEPGSEFRYSNTNYTILGILIEEVTGQAYHEVLRDRIIDPLGMSSTYLAIFDDGTAPFDPFEGDVGPGFDYTSLATGAWSGGGMVSSAGDLHIFFSALSDGEVISTDMYEAMTDSDEYGLGLEMHGDSYGHSGQIPGYDTFVTHSPDTGITGFVATTAPGLDLSYVIGQFFQGLDARTAN